MHGVGEHLFPSGKRGIKINHFDVRLGGYLINEGGDFVADSFVTDSPAAGETGRRATDPDFTSKPGSIVNR